MVSTPPVVHPLSCEYLSKFSKKFETALTEYSGAWGNLIHEKNLKLKSSWHCPFFAVSPNTLLVFSRQIQLLEKISPNSLNCVLGGEIEPEKSDTRD
jgi:hypothetical protein